MPNVRLASCVALAILAASPAAAATAFWPFGFYFPDKAHHHAGGLSARDRVVKVAGGDLPDRALPAVTPGPANRGPDRAGITADLAADARAEQIAAAF